MNIMEDTIEDMNIEIEQIEYKIEFLEKQNRITRF